MEGGTFLSRSPRDRTEGQDCHWWVALTTHMTQAQPPHRRHPPATVQNSWRETQQCPPTKGKALRIAMWRDGSKEKGPWPITKENPNGSSGNIVISWSHGEPPFPLGKLALCPYFMVVVFLFFVFFFLLYSFHGHNLKLLTQLIFNIISFQNEWWHLHSAFKKIFIMVIQTPFLCLKDFKAVVLFFSIYFFIFGCTGSQLVVLSSTSDP